MRGRHPQRSLPCGGRYTAPVPDHHYEATIDDPKVFTTPGHSRAAGAETTECSLNGIRVPNEAVLSSFRVYHPRFSAWARTEFMTGQRGPNKPGPVQRMPDGKPNLEVFGSPSTRRRVRRGGASGSFALFAGKSIVIDPADGKIPYQGWARAKQQDLQLHHMYEEPEAHWLPIRRTAPDLDPIRISDFAAAQLCRHAMGVHARESHHRDGRAAAHRFEDQADAGRLSGPLGRHTLVIDTTNLNDKTWFDSAGNFHSDAEHVVERFTRWIPIPSPFKPPSKTRKSTIASGRSRWRSWRIPIRTTNRWSSPAGKASRSGALHDKAARQVATASRFP